MNTITWVAGAQGGDKCLLGYIGLVRVFRIQERVSLGQTPYFELYARKGHWVTATLDLAQACQHAEEIFSDLERLSLLATEAQVHPEKS